jgi:hypothetical protein
MLPLQEMGAMIPNKCIYLNGEIVLNMSVVVWTNLSEDLCIKGLRPRVAVPEGAMDL